MDNLAIALAVVVFLIIVYFLFFSSTDQKFIDSVAAAKVACAVAVKTQTEADFKLAIDAAALAKTNMSASLNQYAPVLTTGSIIPPDVAAAVKDLGNINCGMHVLDAAALNAISTATAACNAAVKSDLDADAVTAAVARNAALAAIKAALAQYPSGDPVTVALKAAITAFQGLKCSNYPSAITFTKTSTDPPDNNTFQISQVKAFDAAGVELPRSAFGTPYFTVDNDKGYSLGYPASNVLNGSTSIGNFAHSSNGPEPIKSMVVPLAAPTKLSKIVVYNRIALGGRLAGVVMDIIGPGKSVVLTSDLVQTITL